MPEHPVLKAAGLHTAANSLSGVPQGALAKADNVIIRFPGVIEPRRGQYVTGPGYQFGSAASLANTLTFYQDTLLVHYGSGTLALLFNLALTNLAGSFPAPTNSLGIKTKFIEAQQDLYFTTSNGIYFKDSPITLTAPVPAGMKRAADVMQGIFYAGNGNAPFTSLDFAPQTTAGTWMAANTKVGYRVSWYKKDASGRTIYSSPSGRSVYANTTASTVQWLQFYVPALSNVTSSMSMQVYRTPQSVTSTTDPGDNYYLAFEAQASDPVVVVAGAASKTGATITCTAANTYHVGDFVSVTSASDGAYAPTAGNTAIVQITVASASSFAYTFDGTIGTGTTSTGTITATPFAYLVSDYAPDSMLGAPLYTNPLDGDGSLLGLSDNAEPPLALDLTYWNFRNWYANTTSKQRYQIQLLGVSAPNGLVANDTITINGQTYTAITGTPASAKAFALVTSNSSVSLNVEATAKALCCVINANLANTTLVAYYLSGVSGAPGLIQLEEVGIGGAAFTVSVSRSSAWAPNLATAQSSTNDAAPNRLFYSKYRQPEAVPLLNYLDLGARTKNILRILPLRDKLYVFKEDGIFTVSGSGPPYRVDLLDNTSRLVAPETAVVFANQIWALTNQGVVSVSELGVQIQSAPIEDQLLPLYATFPNQVKTASFATAYESDRTFILALPTTVADTFAKQQFWYNYETKAWTHHTLARTCGQVLLSQDLLFMGAAPGAISGQNSIYTERKSFLAPTNADDSIVVSYLSSSVGANWIQLSTTSVGNIYAPGDIVLFAGAGQAVITAVDSPNVGYITVNNMLDAVGNPSPWTGGVTILKAIPCEVVWQLNVDSAPGTTKHWREGTLHFRRFAAVVGAQVETYTEADASTTATKLSTLGWGEVVWDSSTPISPTTAILDVYSPWGLPSAPKNERFLVGANKQRSAYMYIGFKVLEAYSDWALQGVTLEAEPGSERTTVR